MSRSPGHDCERLCVADTCKCPPCNCRDCRRRAYIAQERAAFRAATEPTTVMTLFSTDHLDRSEP